MFFFLSISSFLYKRSFGHGYSRDSAADKLFYTCRKFCIRGEFVSNPATLRKRLVVVGLAMLLLSPFLVIFMLVYLFLRHAEQFYNHPTTASSRRWSNLSKWMLVLLLFGVLVRGMFSLF